MPKAVGERGAQPTGHLSGVTPDGARFWDEGIFRSELERFFFRSWLCIGHERELANTGDFFTRRIGREHLLFVRDREGEVRGFYNVCRHRGTLLILEPSGSGLQSITCPYHSWNYGLDGKLRGAPHMQDVSGFQREQFGLYPVRVASWGGFLFANLEADGPSLARELGPFFERFDRFPLAELRLGRRQVYDVDANWKLLVENYSECYHCAPVHPQLNRLTPYLSGENDAYFHEGEPQGKFSGGYMTFAGDFTSMTTTGYTKRPPLPGMTAEDRKRVYYYTLFPNFFFSLHPDYLMVHRTWPVSPSHSTVECEFYFDPTTMAREDFDPSDAFDIWDATNKQDWGVCELAQKGTGSRRWHGGRYSAQESLVYDFDTFVQEQLGRSR